MRCRFVFPLLRAQFAVNSKELFISGLHFAIISDCRTSFHFGDPLSGTLSNKNPVLECQVGVIYQIPVACKFVYISQTARCFNDRALEHKRNIKNTMNVVLCPLNIHRSALTAICVAMAALSKIIYGLSRNPSRLRAGKALVGYPIC